MTSPAQQNIVEQIHASGRQLVIALTGGGSGAIAALLQVPGASASVLEAIVPYSATAMQQWLGGAVEQYCSEKTARAMAMRAFERARELSDIDPHKLIGVGATASLATNRPKRGAHRIHVAWQSATTTAVFSLLFKGNEGSRAEEEDIATRLILRAISEASELTVPPLTDLRDAQLDMRVQRAPHEWTELLLGKRSVVEIPSRSGKTDAQILFPGAFNPPHWGHERMTEIAAERYGRPVTFELSITNVDKPPLDFIEIADRLEQLAGRPVLLSRAPTFAEKAVLAPGCVFVVGADTLERIADPRYYENDVAKRDSAIAQIANLGCRFLVFGRSRDNRFATASAVVIPPALRDLCDEVEESEFRADVSSTDLRADTMDSRKGAENAEGEH